MNKFQWNFNQNTKLFIHENASENVVCEMAAILSRGRWVKETYAVMQSIPLQSVQLQRSSILQTGPKRQQATTKQASNTATRATGGNKTSLVDNIGDNISSSTDAT